MPQIQDNLIKEVERDGGFYQVAQNQDGVFLNNNREEICALATKLSSAYGTELLCELEQHMADLELKKDETKSNGTPAADETVHKCGTCQEPAKKKCANCKLVHYCSRWVSQFSRENFSQLTNEFLVSNSRECQLKDWPQHKDTCMSKAV